MRKQGIALAVFVSISVIISRNVPELRSSGSANPSLFLTCMPFGGLCNQIFGYINLVMLGYKLNATLVGCHGQSRAAFGGARPATSPFQVGYVTTAGWTMHPICTFLDVERMAQYFKNDPGTLMTFNPVSCAT